ncbi:Retrotransposon gag protein [Corchorus capsularis]|uniref:Retrotransposon gag protein n=1 Tax=Corchorus capsularis TaxID=210143 RepID=A0A1R3JVE0_COCAP|nr:Retrotransposon gag protein [Corchorus capsularis]
MSKTRSSSIEGLEFNPQPERTLFQKNKKKTQSRLQEEESSNSSFQPSSPRSAVSTSSEDMAEEEQPKTLRELAAPNVNAKRLAIRYPDTNGNFEIKSRFIQILPKFHGLPGEDPHRHLTDFQIACASTSIQGILEDQFMLRTFPFTLMDRAKDWLYLLPTDSITSWTSLKKLFLEKYFPAHKASSIRKEICGIKQHHGETMHEYWERFKTLCASCPNHQINEQLLIQYFYEGLLPFDRSSIDSASGGAFIDKTPAEAWSLVENMAANTQQFGSREDYSREGPTRRINEVSTYSTSLEQQLQETNQQIALLTDLFHANFSSVPRVCATLEDNKQGVNVVGLQGAYQRKPEPYWRPEQSSQQYGNQDEPNNKGAAPIKDSNKDDAATQPKGKGVCDTNKPKTDSNLIPFQSRLKKSKKEDDDQDILEIFRKIEVNIPLLDAIQQIPNDPVTSRFLHPVAKHFLIPSAELLSSCFEFLYKDGQPSTPHKFGCLLQSCCPLPSPAAPSFFSATSTSISGLKMADLGFALQKKVVELGVSFPTATHGLKTDI